MENGFEGLSSAFNVENELDDIQKEIATIDLKKNALVNKATDTQIMLQDQSFLQDELKSLITCARTVMVKLEKDIKVGSAARLYEVYAKLLDSIGNQYRVLLDLDKSIFEAMRQTNKLDINDIGNRTINLTANQLADMMEAAGKRSQINAIEADFQIENDGFHDDARKNVNNV